jgi:hypothetical protein
MELPVFLPVKDLGEKLLETLRTLSPADYAKTSALRLRHAGRELEDAETLASAGLWDGGILETIAEGGHMQWRQ